jgi:peptidoglycan L-alanyl-D-glutamate endopeptidase CwlK
MSRRLDDLDPRFRPLAIELLARCVEQGIAVMVIDTLRTPEEHAANLANGVSWTQRSKHLDGLAIDICPYHSWQLHGPDKLQWDATDPAWTAIGRIGEELGLRWGGRWKQKDLGHFEYTGT